MRSSERSNFRAGPALPTGLSASAKRSLSCLLQLRVCMVPKVPLLFDPHSTPSLYSHEDYGRGSPSGHEAETGAAVALCSHNSGGSGVIRSSPGDRSSDFRRVQKWKHTEDRLWGFACPPNTMGVEQRSRRSEAGTRFRGSCATGRERRGRSSGRLAAKSFGIPCGGAGLFLSSLSLEKMLDLELQYYYVLHRLVVPSIILIPREQTWQHSAFACPADRLEIQYTTRVMTI